MHKKFLQLTCILLLSAGSYLWAQAVGGTLSGKITSASGSGIPNAAVTVTNTTNNVSQKVLTGPDGGFTISNLGPGVYRVDVETAGYKRTTQQNVELLTTGPTTITVRMEPGSINETVEVRGHSPAIDTDGGEISTAIDTRTLQELPIIDRNYQELIGLPSGVTPPIPALDMVRDPDRNRYASVNGQSPTANLWMNDGVMNLEPFRNTAIRVQPIESVQQFNMETASLPAERGFAGGGIFNSITRPGTNDWHGSLFEFYSSNILRTRNYFNIAANPDPRFVYNQFGATFGGPLVKDRTFFFGSYEGTYQNGGITQVSTVPTAAMIAGNFSAVPGLTLYRPGTGTTVGINRTPFTGNMIPSNLINPTAAAIARFFPAPNLAGFSNNYVSNVPFQNHGNKADGRLDHHFSDRTNLFLRYGFTNYRAAESSPLGDVIGAGTRDRLLNHNAILGIIHNFGPALAMDLRMGYNRYDQRLNPLSDQTALATAFRQPSFANDLVGINITGLAPIGSPAYVPMNAVDNTFNWVWNWSLHTSMHNLKWGIDIRRIRSDGFTDAMWSNMFGPNGTAFFNPGATMSVNGPALSQFGAFSNSFAAFLLGAPSQVGIANFLTTPTIRQTQYGGWIGDVINLAHRVSLDIGVRYEIYSPLEPRNVGGAAFFDVNRNVFNYAGIGDILMHSNDYDLNNLAPRVGISLKATDKTVLRAGYSMQYFQTPYMLSGFMAPMYGAVSGVQGGFTTAAFSGTFGPTVTSTITAPSLVNGASAGNLPATVLPSQITTPYVQSFNLQLQQEFYWGTVLSVGYVGALDRHLPFVQELNAAAPGTGTAGLPFNSFGRTASTLGFDNGLTSNYNSLQVSLNKRFTRGLSFLGSYTWSKALGYTGENGMLLNPFNLASNYGPLDYDRQHNLTISHIWELPFGRHGSNIFSTILGGWQWNGIFTWSTGTPLTITADPISCACPGSTVFANLSGSPYSTLGGASFLNSAAFSAPRNSFGDLGRGALRGPDMWNYDMSLLKNFRVRDRFNLQLRGEAFNVTNSTRFAPPVTNISSPDFGRSVATVNGAYGRQVNLGLRVTF